MAGMSTVPKHSKFHKWFQNTPPSPKPFFRTNADLTFHFHDKPPSHDFTPATCSFWRKPGSRDCLEHKLQPEDTFWVLTFSTCNLRRMSRTKFRFHIFNFNLHFLEDASREIRFCRKTDTRKSCTLQKKTASKHGWVRSAAVQGVRNGLVKVSDHAWVGSAFRLPFFLQTNFLGSLRLKVCCPLGADA
jgi:hypothetical protein